MLLGPCLDHGFFLFLASDFNLLELDPADVPQGVVGEAEELGDFVDEVFRAETVGITKPLPIGDDAKDQRPRRNAVRHSFFSRIRWRSDMPRTWFHVGQRIGTLTLSSNLPLVAFGELVD